MSKPNPVAKAVRTSKFRKRIVRARKGKGSYRRLPRNRRSVNTL